ncbi:hypothetical protein [Veillonella magna]|uniref:hypothetical protein n=1 Tax=Veillonella magna TaxID=464322 RepID=UPI0023F5180B|nr:hypothetical protein [Veillonella magna]
MKDSKGNERTYEKVENLALGKDRNKGLIAGIIYINANDTFETTYMRCITDIASLKLVAEGEDGNR